MDRGVSYPEGGGGGGSTKPFKGRGSITRPTPPGPGGPEGLGGGPWIHCAGVVALLWRLHCDRKHYTNGSSGTTATSTGGLPAQCAALVSKHMFFFWGGRATEILEQARTF